MRREGTRVLVVVRGRRRMRIVIISRGRVWLGLERLSWRWLLKWWARWRLEWWTQWWLIVYRRRGEAPVIRRFVRMVIVLWRHMHGGLFIGPRSLEWRYLLPVHWVRGRLGRGGGLVHGSGR